MTNETETLPTPAEVDAMLLAMDRFLETQEAIASAKNSFEAYWAGSASASVERDYRAGRVITIHAGRK
jgi:hypothetical protein